MDECVAGSSGDSAQPGLDFGPQFFDGVEVGRIRRQIPDTGSDFFDGLLDADDFMAGEIVHDHDVSFVQCRRQAFFDVTAEGDRIGGPIEHDGSFLDDSGGADGAEQGRGSPMALRCGEEAALANRRSPIQARQVRLRPGFIEKYEVFRACESTGDDEICATALHVGTIALAGPQRFFLTTSLAF